MTHKKFTTTAYGDLIVGGYTPINESTVSVVSVTPSTLTVEAQVHLPFGFYLMWFVMILAVVFG